MLERQKVIKVGTQEVMCEYPNVRQKIKIENLKMLFTDNMYGDLSRSSHISGNELLDIVDAYSTLMVCCPSLKLDEAKFQVIDDTVSKVMREAYLLQVYPWFESIKTELAGVDLSTKDKEHE